MLSSKETEDYEQIVLAAIDWKDSRSDLVNSAMKDPLWREKLNALSQAESTLSLAIDKLRKKK